MDKDYEWKPPEEEETMLGFPVQDESHKPAPDHSWMKSDHVGLRSEKIPPSELFAYLATTLIMYGMLFLTFMLIVGLAVRMVRWVAGL